LRRTDRSGGQLGASNGSPSLLRLICWQEAPRGSPDRIGELKVVIARISDRPRRAISPFLIQEENGQPLTLTVLRNRFEKARRAAGVEFQFRELRAKARTDTGDLAHSQKLLAHKNREMTEHYVRSRIGERVRPLR
jgi:integrase